MYRFSNGGFGEPPLYGWAVVMGVEDGGVGGGSSSDMASVGGGGDGGGGGGGGGGQTSFSAPSPVTSPQ